MKIIAMAFVAVGYVLMYWGACNVKHWPGIESSTTAATMATLFGTQTGKNVVVVHDVPWPVKAASSATPATGNSSAPVQGSNGAALNPNFPGNPGQQMQNVPLPGSG
jgi:hypothetical protein